MDEVTERIARWITEAKSVVIFTGAGLSTESGIPDFRSPGGVWDKYNPEDFYFDRFMASEISRWKYWQMATEMYEPMKKAQPNAAHLAIAELEKLGKLDCVITQNIDNLHVRAGNSPDKVIELHGTAMSVSCLSCRKKFDREKVQEKLKEEEKVPYCDSCGGPLKPDTISFGQAMPVKETQEAYERSSACDLFIVIGSSLVVQPAASMPVTAKRNGARLVIINRDPTPCDGMADVVINDQAGATVTALLEKVKNIMAE
ncbi:MAG: NAD-dependent protein deacetylase [Syntrophus sp. PtaB.Bin001]|nr:MAG: NAD-dependent protein deacetylase [Syntrophus sp. PtaB.Bin001]